MAHKAGFLAGACLGWLNLLPKKIEIYKLKKHVIKLEKQLEEYMEETSEAPETTLPAITQNADELYD